MDLPSDQRIIAPSNRSSPSPPHAQATPDPDRRLQASRPKGSRGHRLTALDKQLKIAEPQDHRHTLQNVRTAQSFEEELNQSSSQIDQHPPSEANQSTDADDQLVPPIKSRSPNRQQSDTEQSDTGQSDQDEVQSRAQHLRQLETEALQLLDDTIDSVHLSEKVGEG